LTRAIIAIASVILAAAFPGRAGASNAPGEDLFKWGEYDSLIRLLVPVGTTALPAAAADSAERAKSYLFLGVAYYVTGKTAQADSAFVSACGLDPQVKLDRFYVTEEIANHFHAIALDEARRRQARSETRAVSTEATTRAPAEPGRPSGSGRSLLARSGGRKWAWWGLGTTALGIAGVGILLLMTWEERPSEKVTRIDARP
jgi:hypothetical protein